LVLLWVGEEFEIDWLICWKFDGFGVGELCMGFDDDLLVFGICIECALVPKHFDSMVNA
jgi:hypothetical protein